MPSPANVRRSSRSSPATWLRSRTRCAIRTPRRSSSRSQGCRPTGRGRSTASGWAAGSAVPVHDPTRRGARAPKVRGELPSPANPPSGCRFRTRCTRAQEICAHEEPPLRPFGHLGHLAAFHFPLVEPLAVDQSGQAQTAGATPSPRCPDGRPERVDEPQRRGLLT
ncbi:MAG: oligopeptide/dipeptide ABC transporter ATP-binding protein [Acidimicrobiales bacterium]